MAKGIYRGVSGVARKVTKQYRGVSGVARKVTKQYVGVSGVARQTFASDLYLIKDGEYQVDFTTTSYGSWYKITDENSKFAVTEEDGYIQLYNSSFWVGALITSDAIDLSQYSTLHIEADISIHDWNNSIAYNRSEVGAYNSIPTTLGEGCGDDWVAGSGTIFSKVIHTSENVGDEYVAVSESIDISSYTASGHIFAYATSDNYSGDYAYMRIKNMWLE